MIHATLRRTFDAVMDRRLRHLAPADLPLAMRLDAFQRFGDHSLAYSATVQKGLLHWGDGSGFIAYGRMMGQALALGDPVADPAARDRLIGDFIAAAGAPSFAEISEPTAALLAARGYRVMRMGVDTALDLATYDFSGGRKETVRYSERWLLKHGYSIGETWQFPELTPAIKALARDWRRERIVHRREMGFLNRPFPGKEEPLSRRFVLVGPDGAPVSVLYFDPLCRGGRVIGYLTAFKRRAADATAHAEIGLTKHAVDRFKREGVEKVMLGLSPLLDIEPSGFDESARFRALMQRFYASGLVNRRIFNLQGHAAFKRRFHGREEPRYFAWKTGLPLMPFTALLRLSRAF
ncbi:MAG: DUF2156 domain-containing protein [Methylobacterium mesophilicum]|nr:DUF2156 domain-containing protein [Methylobacterium mesophilicum]